MNILIGLIIWYLIGLLISSLMLLLMQDLKELEIKVEDVFFVVIASLFGPMLILFIIWFIIEEQPEVFKKIGNKVIYKRKK